MVSVICTNFAKLIYNISGLTGFDKKLRLLLFNEIEKIEIAVRCAIVNFGTEMTGNSFWMTDANNFSNPSKFNRSIRLIEDELNHTKDDFINHFKETYTNQYPPSWMPTEILPFGVITNVYSNIKNKKIKKRIAQSFGLQVAPFESWLTIITVTRNSCCHHARVWNRVFSIRATMPIRMSRSWITLPTDPLKVYFDMCIIKYILDIISPNNDMLDKMNRLFATFSAGLSEKSSKCVCFSIFICIFAMPFRVLLYLLSRHKG